jgi:hypothetical protein
MACAANSEKNLRMVVVAVKDRRDGVFLVLVPTALTARQVEEAFHEVGVKPEQVYEVGGWQIASAGVSVAWLPFPAR